MQHVSTICMLSMWLAIKTTSSHVSSNDDDGNSSGNAKRACNAYRCWREKAANEEETHIDIDELCNSYPCSCPSQFVEYS